MKTLREMNLNSVKIYFRKGQEDCNKSLLFVNLTSNTSGFVLLSKYFFGEIRVRFFLDSFNKYRNGVSKVIPVVLDIFCK